MTKQDLIAALEAASEPSRELDLAIALNIGLYDFLLHNQPDIEISEAKWIWPENYQRQGGYAEITLRLKGRTMGGVRYTQEVPAYTSSLDAALKLIPEGSRWLLHSDGDARIYTMADDEFIGISDGDIPAVAVSIAALKARP